LDSRPAQPAISADPSAILGHLDGPGGVWPCGVSCRARSPQTPTTTWPARARRSGSDVEQCGRWVAPPLGLWLW